MRAKTQFSLSLPQLFREFTSRLYNLLKFLRGKVCLFPTKGTRSVGYLTNNQVATVVEYHFLLIIPQP